MGDTERNKEINLKKGGPQGTEEESLPLLVRLYNNSYSCEVVHYSLADLDRRP